MQTQLNLLKDCQILAVVAEEMLLVEPKHIPTAFWAMLETIQMAFIGTVVGVAIALPFKYAWQHEISTTSLCMLQFEHYLAAIRTFPSILWAILFVIMVGLGPFAGILAIIMYTVGFVAKLQYEAIETIDSDPMDAVSSIGVSKWQLIRYVVIPESASTSS